MQLCPTFYRLQPRLTRAFRKSDHVIATECGNSTRGGAEIGSGLISPVTRCGMRVTAAESHISAVFVAAS